MYRCNIFQSMAFGMFGPNGIRARWLAEEVFSGAAGTARAHFMGAKIARALRISHVTVTRRRVPVSLGLQPTGFW